MNNHGLTSICSLIRSKLIYSMLRTVSNWIRRKLLFIFHNICVAKYSGKFLRRRKKYHAIERWILLSPKWNYDQKFTKQTKDSDFHALVPFQVVKLSGGARKTNSREIYICILNFKMLCNHKNVQLLWPRTHFKLTAKVNFPFVGRANWSSLAASSLSSSSSSSPIAIA